MAIGNVIKEIKTANESSGVPSPINLNVNVSDEVSKKDFTDIKEILLKIYNKLSQDFDFNRQQQDLLQNVTQAQRDAQELQLKKEDEIDGKSYSRVTEDKNSGEESESSFVGSMLKTLGVGAITAAIVTMLNKSGMLDELKNWFDKAEFSKFIGNATGQFEELFDLEKGTFSKFITNFENKANEYIKDLKESAVGKSIAAFGDSLATAGKELLNFIGVEENSFSEFVDTITNAGKNFKQFSDNLNSVIYNKLLSAAESLSEGMKEFEKLIRKVAHPIDTMVDAALENLRKPADQTPWYNNDYGYSERNKPEEPGLLDRAADSVRSAREGLDEYIPGRTPATQESSSTTTQEQTPKKKWSDMSYEERKEDARRRLNSYLIPENKETATPQSKINESNVQTSSPSTETTSSSSPATPAPSPTTSADGMETVSTEKPSTIKQEAYENEVTEIEEGEEGEGFAERFKDIFRRSPGEASAQELEGLRFVNNPEEQSRISSALAKKLQELRKELKLNVLVINSGFRNPEYNKKVKGAPNSYHTKKLAVDVSQSGWNTDQRKNFIATASSLGFGGIGIYHSFTHIDLGPVRNWIEKGYDASWAEEELKKHMGGKGKKTATPVQQDSTTEQGEINSSTESNKSVTEGIVGALQSLAGSVLDFVIPAAGAAETTTRVPSGQTKQEQTKATIPVSSTSTKTQITAPKNEAKEYSGNAKEAFDFFLAKGFTPEQSAGIVGSLQGESANLNPHDKNPTSTAYGIGQWTESSGRLSELKERKGWNSLEGQLEYIYDEITGATKHKEYGKLAEKIRAVTGRGAEERVARIWTMEYEKPAERDQKNSMKKRMKNASTTLAAFAGAEPETELGKEQFKVKQAVRGVGESAVEMASTIGKAIGSALTPKGANASEIVDPNDKEGMMAKVLGMSKEASGFMLGMSKIAKDSPFYKGPGMQILGQARVGAMEGLDDTVEFMQELERNEEFGKWLMRGFTGVGNEALDTIKEKVTPKRNKEAEKHNKVTDRPTESSLHEEMKALSELEPSILKRKGNQAKPELNKTDDKLRSTIHKTEDGEYTIQKLEHDALPSGEIPAPTFKVTNQVTGEEKSFESEKEATDYLKSMGKKVSAASLDSKEGKELFPSEQNTPDKIEQRKNSPERIAELKRQASGLYNEETTKRAKSELSKLETSDKNEPGDLRDLIPAKQNTKEESILSKIKPTETKELGGLQVEGSDMVSSLMSGFSSIVPNLGATLPDHTPNSSQSSVTTPIVNVAAPPAQTQKIPRGGTVSQQPNPPMGGEQSVRNEEATLLQLMYDNFFTAKV